MEESHNGGSFPMVTIHPRASTFPLLSFNDWTWQMHICLLFALGRMQDIPKVVKYCFCFCVLWRARVLILLSILSFFVSFTWKGRGVWKSAWLEYFLSPLNPGHIIHYPLQSKLFCLSTKGFCSQLPASSIFICNVLQCTIIIRAIILPLTFWGHKQGCALCTAAPWQL